MMMMINGASPLGVESWAPKDVALWIAGVCMFLKQFTVKMICFHGDSCCEELFNNLGLHISLREYSSSFFQQGVTGERLLTLMGADLVQYGVNRVGDQLMFEEALQTLRWVR
jgi:hypothetical protein